MFSKNVHLLVLSMYFCSCLPPQQSPEPPRRESVDEVVGDKIKELLVDQDGNDTWEQAVRVQLHPERAYLLYGELGIVDREGVLDTVDYFRFQARHRSMLVHVDGDVAVELVTANDVPVSSSSQTSLWYNSLSVEGGYALRVTARNEASTRYVLTIGVGGHVREACADVCRFGLSCEDGRCIQAAALNEHCLVDGDCSTGVCQQQYCVDVGQSCKSTGEGGEAFQCRAGALRRCVAEQWYDVGRCDSGCIDDACAPLPLHCEIDGARLCHGFFAAVCDGERWRSPVSDPACGHVGFDEGAPCTQDSECNEPFRCMQTDPIASTYGVCALPCQQRGAACHDAKTCGLLLDNTLFCLNTISTSRCDLSALQACRGALAGACFEQQCFASCEQSTCPGTGCACGNNIDCQSVDNRGELAQVGICANIAATGEPCDEHRWCDDGSLCIIEQSGDLMGTCRTECTGYCPEGYACYELVNGSGACLPD